jgi:hypothetical protein
MLKKKQIFVLTKGSTLEGQDGQYQRAAQRSRLGKDKGGRQKHL